VQTTRPHGERTGVSSGSTIKRGSIRKERVKVRGARSIADIMDRDQARATCYWTQGGFVPASQALTIYSS
jgi:hypothetical protein